jgi:threonine synthase
MNFYSTKSKQKTVDLKEAILKGLPPDNGLYMPAEIPQFDRSFIEDLPNKRFVEIAVETSKLYLSEYFSEQEIFQLCEEAFDFPVPLVELKNNIFALELFHGPTLAFKDFGARFMSRVMGKLHGKSGKPLHILVATSGDTGSAVAQGFFGVPGIQVTILYPQGKVSKIQEQQLTTNGGNIAAVEIEGTFDDCQRLVKTAFLDKELSSAFNLTSANSINISRLIPQSFYYTYAYGQLCSRYDEIHFCVPSGNFGNITGGLLAQKMGVPITGFAAATNVNDIVPAFLNGKPFLPRPSQATISNAMDVGNPSNFPRMEDLFGDQELFRSTIEGFSYSDEETRNEIQKIYNEQDYLMCPHSAVGHLGVSEYMQNKKGAGVFLATAHPVKFSDVVNPLISNDIEIPERLQKIINREKKATILSTDFEAFKKYLLK